MINRKVLFLGFPIYVIVAVVVETLLGPGNLTSTAHAPAWMVIAFCLTGFAAASVGLWLVLRRAAGKTPNLRQDFYWTLLLALGASGVTESAGKGLATVLLGGCPWWALVPIFAVSYAVMWAVVAVMLTRSSRSASTAQ